MSKAAAIRKWRDKGLEPAAVAEIVGVTVDHVHAQNSLDRKRRAENIPLRKPGRQRSERGDAMAMAYAKFGSYAAVAKIYGCSVVNVWWCVQRRGGRVGA